MANREPKLEFLVQPVIHEAYLVTHQQYAFTCVRCRKTIKQNVEYYFQQLTVPILFGYEWRWKWLNNDVKLVTKRLRLRFHQGCYDFRYVRDKFEVYWIP